MLRKFSFNFKEYLKYRSLIIIFILRFCIVIALFFFLNSFSALKSSVDEENRKIFKATELANGDNLMTYDTTESGIENEF